MHAQQMLLLSLRQGERPREREYIGKRSDDETSKGDWEEAAQKEKKQERVRPRHPRKSRVREGRAVRGWVLLGSQVEGS